MEEKRPNPEAILKNLLEQEKKKHRGRLKIFFGYAAGVGKTYAMLQEAHTLHQEGVDVVIGYAEPHQRPKTLALFKGLPTIAPLEIKFGEGTLKEFNIDAALARKPAVILVDELAHTNLKGCRHAKRYQDIEELLCMGIDVYTTVNVQHIESLHDVVEAITGIAVRERVPDYIFDSADKVELVDIEPDDLLARLGRGEVYGLTKLKRALANFFTRENLLALREIALRRTADRLNITVEKNKQLSNSSYSTGEHILMCLSSSPSNAKVVRTAAKMAEAFRGSFTALFVKTSDFENMQADDKKRLNENINLAEQLGARIVTVYGDDVAYQLAEYAKISGISKLVLGRSPERNFLGFRTTSYVDILNTLAPNLEVYVIPNKLTPKYYHKPNSKTDYLSSISFKGFSIVFICMAIATAIGYAFKGFYFEEINIVIVYLFAALTAAALTEGKIYGVFASLLAIFLFSFLFAEPIFSVDTYKTEYKVTFVIMFISALTMSILSKRAREQKRLASQNSYRTEMLLETSKKLQNAKDLDSVFNEIVCQLQKILERKALLYPVKDGLLEQAVVENSDYQAMAEYLTEYELAVAEWVFKNNKQAGTGTDTLSAAKCLYLPIANENEPMAVVGIVMEDGANIEPFEKSLLFSVLMECALAIEKENLLAEKSNVYLQANRIQMRSGITRAIVEELHVPLNKIATDAQKLHQQWQHIPEQQADKLVQDIAEEAAWLNKLVDNMLNNTHTGDKK